MATRRIKNPESVDAIDIALARAVDSDEARALLARQARLIDAQETLAQADLRYRGWQIIGERVGAFLKAMMAGTGLLVIAMIATFLWSAHKASGLVMDPFNVPPAFDKQGLTGVVVAEQLLDKVTALENGTQSARASSSYENSWSDSKGVEVPYTGVSFGELRREARDWLGSEKHLDGDVVQLPGDTIAISFRTPLGSGRVEGPDSNIDGVIGQAAVLLFKTTQPYRYAIWRQRNGASTEELRQIFTALTHSSDPREVAWGYHGLANDVATSFAESRAYYAKPLAVQPNFLPALGNFPFYSSSEGHDEQAHREYVVSASAYGNGAEDYTPSHAMHYGLRAQSMVAGYEGDLTKSAKLMSVSSSYAADAVNSADGPFAAASAWSLAHDFVAAKAQVAAAGYLDPGRRAEVEKLTGPQPSVAHLFANATDDFAGQAEGLTAIIDQFRVMAAAAADGKSSADSLAQSDRLRPDMAIALARTGRLAEARATVAPLPSSSDPALRAKAFVAMLARDPAAPSMFAQAAARTPTLPEAEMLWSEALFRTGRADEALGHAETAVELGPHSAEASYWRGKELLTLHRVDEAAAAFAKAAQDEPQWGALHLEWAEALWQSGKRAEAVDALRAAATMALSPADKARLQRMVSGVRNSLRKER